MRMAARTNGQPTQRKSRRFAKVLSALLLVAFLAISGCAARQLYQDYIVRHTQAQLTQLHRAVSVESAEEQTDGDWSRGMLELNPDYAGWLTVYGTEVDGPVVQGEDNDEYLRTDFYGNYSIGGVFFMDCLADCAQDGNLMIYGHMMYDETMFGPLRKYRDAAFFKENNVLRWEDRSGEHFYKFVAGLILPDTADDTEYIDFRQWLNEQDAETTQRMLEIVEENAYIFQPDIMRDGSEKYLFLMTCTNNGANRLLLVAEPMD